MLAILLVISMAALYLNFMILFFGLFPLRIISVIRLDIAFHAKLKIVLCPFSLGMFEDDAVSPKLKKVYMILLWIMGGSSILGSLLLLYMAIH